MNHFTLLKALALLSLMLLFSPFYGQVSLPYMEGFESAGPMNTFVSDTNSINGLSGTGYGWSYEKTLDGRLRFDTGLGLQKSGSFAATLDDTVGGGISINYLILTLDLSNRTTTDSIIMDFSFMNHGDEDNVNDMVWIRERPDSAWVQIYDWHPGFGAIVGVYTDVAGINLTAALVAASQGYSDSTQIRFGQEDDGSTTSSTAIDGVSFDDILIYKTLTADAGITAILSPSSDCGLTTGLVSVVVENFGTAALTSVPLAYQINGGAIVRQTMTGLNILPGNSTTLFFTTPANLATIGTYDFAAFTEVVGDVNTFNDTSTLRVEHIPTVTSFPYIQNFENGTGGWTPSGNNSATWEMGTPAGQFIIGAASGSNAWMTGLSSTYTDNDTLFVRSPCLDFTSVVNPSIRMSVWWESFFDDETYLESSIDNGTTWQAVGLLGDPNNWYNNADGWGGSSAGWLTAEHDLPGTAGQSNVILRFNFSSNTFGESDGFAFDDVIIFGQIADDAGIDSVRTPLTGCALTSTEAVSIKVTNHGTSTLNTIPVAYQINGGTIVRETITSAGLATGASMNYTFTTLANFSTVGAYNIIAFTEVTTDNNNFNDTAFATVSHLLTVSTFPYFQDFESGNGSWTSNGSNTSWELNAPTNPIINSAASGVNAWITNASGTYSSSEEGFVVSPCFDFSSLSAPKLQMSVWWNCEGGWDGGSFASSIDGGLTWQQIGTVASGVNWFNRTPINSSPGRDGWSGSGGFSGSGGWVTSEHLLTSLANQSAVLLRFEFYSDGSVQMDGIAFDDVAIFQLPAIDAGVDSVLSPLSGCGLTATETVTMRVHNYGTDTLQTIPVAYQVNGGAIVRQTISNANLAPDSSLIHIFTTTTNLSTTGTYTILSFTEVVGDPISFNDTTTYIVNNIPSISSFPYFEDFEGANHAWTHGGTADSWELATPANPTINSASSGVNSWITNATGVYNNNEESFVQGPCFDLSSLSLPKVEMAVWWETENFFDGARLESSIDGGASWQNEGAVGLGVNWYTNTGLSSSGLPGWTGRNGGGSNGWLKAELEMPHLGGQSSVLFRVVFESDGSVFDDGFAFDDFLLYQVPPFNTGVDSLLAPFDNCGFGTNEDVTIRVQNYGSDTLRSIPVAYQLNGGSIVRDTIRNIALPPGDSVIHTFVLGVDLTTLGFHNLTTFTEHPADSFFINDTLYSQILHVVTISTYPYFEDFEGGAGDWRVRGQNSSWELGTPGSAVINGAFSGVNSWVTNDSGPHNGNEQSSVISPCFNTVPLLLPIFRAKIWWETQSSFFGGVSDGAVFQASTDGGVTWNNVGSLGDPNNWFQTSPITSNPGGSSDGWGGSGLLGSGQWVEIEHILPGLGGQSSVMFRFAFGSDAFGSLDGIAFDDVEIFEAPPDLRLAQVVRPGLVSCGVSDSVCILFTNASGVPFNNIDLTYVLDGGTPVTQRYTANVNPGDSIRFCFNTLANYPVTGNHDILVYLAHPGDSVSRNDTARVQFVNIPNITSFPYFEDFEGPNPGWTHGGINDDWVLATPAKTVINTAASGSNSWITNDSFLYQNSAQAFVMSPCLDFSGMTLPKIRMSVWWDCENRFDGTALQSTIDAGLTWQTVGAVGTGTNWYNNSGISANPGGSSSGWSGRGVTGSGGWVVAEHRMASLAGEPQVQLRVVFGSDGSVVGDGFAFDDVLISQVEPNDLGVTNILSPNDGNCGLANQNVEVMIENFGLNPQVNFPVRASINGGAPLFVMYTDTLFPDSTAIVTIGAFNLAAGGAFTIASWTDLSNDQQRVNDTVIEIINITAIPPAPTLSQDTLILCNPGSTQLYVVNADTNLTYNWYNAAVSGTIVASGDTINTSFLTRDTTFYVGTTTGMSGLKITEADLGGPDMLEVQNLSADSLDARNYIVLVGDGLSINTVNPTVNSLGQMAPAEIVFWTDGVLNPWGGNLGWGPGFQGWIMIVDTTGGQPDIIDAVFWDYTDSVIQTLNITVAGITITAGHLGWSGDGVLTGLTGSTIARAGRQDTDTEVDWTEGLPLSQGVQNPGLALGCPGDLTPLVILVNPHVPVTLQDVITCGHTTLDAGSGYSSYLWTGPSVTGLMTQTVTATATGTYSVQVTNADGCTGIDTANVFINAAPIVVLGPDTTSCGSVLLNAGNPGMSTIWILPGAGSANGQTVLATTSGRYIGITTHPTTGCSAEDTVNVIILPSPAINIGPLNQLACDFITLNASNPGLPTLWSTGATTQTITVTTSGPITLEVTNPNNGCVSKDSTNITVSTSPVVNLSATGDTTVCDLIILDAGNPGNFYVWNTGGTSQTEAINRSNIPAGGQVSVTVSNASQCSGSDTVTVDIIDLPTAGFSETHNGFQYVFQDNSTGTGLTYSWDFADGNTSTLQNPTHTYAISGFYIVCLTITDSCGAQDRTCDTLLAPNAIDYEFLDGSVNVYPNPTKGVFFIEIDGLLDEVVVEITDARGRTVQRMNIPRTAQGEAYKVDLSEEAEGVYMAIFRADGQKMVRRIVLVK